MQGPRDVIEFWFVEHGYEDWFGGKTEFDAKLAARFGDLHRRVSRGEAWHWRETANGRLAEVLMLDQFSRQLHRGAARAFAQDGMALVLAQEAIFDGADKEGRTPVTWAEGVFLATNSPVAKPSTIALLKKLIAAPPQAQR